MSRHRRIEVSGTHPDTLTHGGQWRFVRGKRDVLIGTEPHGCTIDRRRAVVHPECFQPNIGHRVTLTNRDDRADNSHSNGEWRPMAGIVGVHERITARLYLAHSCRVVKPDRQVAVGPCSTRRHHIAPHITMSGTQ